MNDNRDMHINASIVFIKEARERADHYNAISPHKSNHTHIKQLWIYDMKTISMTQFIMAEGIILQCCTVWCRAKT